MNIELSGHHVEITDAIRETVNNRFSKIDSHYPQLDSVKVTLTVERNVQSIEAVTQYLGSAVAINAESHDLYTAITDGVKKLDSALSHRKGTQSSRRPSKAAGQ